MIYVRAAAVGLVGGIVLAIAWVAAALTLPILAQILQSAGSGGIGGASVGSGSAAVAALVGFAAGFWWTIRRSRAPKTAGTPQ